jgi:hypothetical protein
MAASWSAQILLYPVYALVQGSRLAGKQLSKAAQTVVQVAEERQDLGEPEAIAEISLPSTTTLSSETAIHQVLQTVQSFALPVMPVQTGLAAIQVRGLATQLDSRRLVLVTTQNQVLDILTAVQQQQIAAHMESRRAERLATPAQRFQPQRLWGEVRQLWQKARSLFLGTEPSPPGSVADPALPPAVDLPIRQLLFATQTLLTESEAFALPGAIVPSSIATARMLYSEPIHAPETPIAAENGMAIVPSYIRGVASLVEKKSLVLVTNHNESLDILTWEQQHKLHQRISWNVAHYQRYLKLRQPDNGLIPLRPASSLRHVLPPVRMFQQLMAWMQSGSVAIATNLFQEAAWAEHPAIAKLPEAPHPHSANAAPALPQSNLQRLSARFTQFLSSARSASSIARTPTQDAAIQPIAEDDSSLSSHPTARPVSMGAPQSVAQDSLTQQQAGLRPTNSVQRDQTGQVIPELNLIPELNFIDVDAEATTTGYQISVLEKVLRWLDRLLSWAEQAIERIKRATFGD